jgi:hypothetical protein
MSFLRLRGALGLLLALTLALPAYTCDGYRAPTGELVDRIPQGADSTAYVAAEVPHRPLEKFDATEVGSWLTLLAYTWPLLLFAAQTLRSRLTAHWVASLLAIVFPIASAWWINVAVVLGDMAYGAVASLALLLALWIVALWELRDGRRRLRAVGA